MYPDSLYKNVVIKNKWTFKMCCVFHHFIIYHNYAKMIHVFATSCFQTFKDIWPPAGGHQIMFFVIRYLLFFLQPVNIFNIAAA